MWTRFRMDGRDLEWRVNEGSPRILDIRSVDGRFSVQSVVMDDAYARDQGQIVLSIIGRPSVLGEEFPLGLPWSEWPYQVGGVGVEFARYGIIHTELVRSLIGRWAHRRRHRSPKQQRPAEPGAAADGPRL